MGIAAAGRIRAGEPLSPPGGRVQRRKARTRVALLDSARQLFAAHGPDATTIAQIADGADVAVGSFYNYFATKDDVLAALLQDTLAAQREQVRQLQAQVEDPAEAFSVAQRHFVQLARSDPEWAWLLLRMEMPYLVAREVLGDAAMHDLQAGIDAGRFHVANPELALLASGGAMFAVIHAQLNGELGEHADSEHAEGVLRSFGLPHPEAAEIARRPMPRPPSPGQETAA